MIRIIEDPDCRSTEEFRMEWVKVKVRRTWFERFVHGPVWAPKSQYRTEDRYLEMGVPVAYKMQIDGRLTIVAHPEIAAELREAIK